MHLNEFADMKDYTLPSEVIAVILKQLERIWHDYGIDDNSSFIVRMKKQKTDRRRKLVHAA